MKLREEAIKMTKEERDLLIEACISVGSFSSVLKQFYPDIEIPEHMKPARDPNDVTRSVSAALDLGEQHDLSFARPKLEDVHARLKEMFPTKELERSLK